MEYIVHTPCGPIKGVEGRIEGTIAYKGIRYATASRFEYPVEVVKWDGIYDASNYGNCSYQPRSFYDEEKNLKKIFYYNEFRKNEKYTYCEDCLFLNIWTPKTVNANDKLPVIIYIHGGGFTGGCGHEKHFDGPKWPIHNVIAVTINYRLGPLGFFCLEELKEKHGKTGNYGLYDQLTAIKWIKNNICAFGGDPNNITIMGQSAGAMSVQQLCLSPITKGLFQKAVMSSGGGVSKLLSTPKPDKFYALGNKIKEITQCNSLEDLQNVPVEELFDAWTQAKKELKIFGMPASPVIDGQLIIDDGVNILKKKQHHQIPYMVGANSEDIIPPIIQSMCQKWCNKQEKAYCWMFNHQLPGDKNGAWHSSDLWYWFGTLDNCWRPVNDIDHQISDKMILSLVNFAKTGEPANDWNITNKKNKKVMHFNSNSNMKKVNKFKLWFNLFTKKAVGE